MALSNGATKDGINEDIKDMNDRYMASSNDASKNHEARKRALFDYFYQEHL